MQEYKLINQKNSKGLSLIELMVALALTLIVLLSAAKALSAISSTSMEQSAQNSAQEVADLTFDHISSTIKSIASTPCERIASSSSINWRSGITPFANWLTVNNVGAAVANPDPNGFPTDLIPPSDNLTFYLTGERSAIQSDTGMTGANIVLTSLLPDVTTLADGSIATFMITDCDSMDIFNAQVFTGVGGITLQPTANLLVDYSATNSAIAMLKQYNLSVQYNTPDMPNEWSLVKTVGTGLGATGSPPLTLINNESGSLVAGVESMSVLWGVNTDGSDPKNADVFQNSNQLSSNLANIREVVSVDIHLLVKPQGDNNRNLSRSNNISVLFPDGSTTSQFDMVTPVNLRSWNFTDRDLRRTFSKTITLRNGAI